MRESVKARQAWADYLALGDGRSLARLADHYREQRRTGGKAAVPTTRLRQLEEWSVLFSWQARLQDLADRAAAEAAATAIRRRKEALETGFALDYERIIALKALAQTLLDELTKGDRLWVVDTKWIGSGEFGREVEIERFNHHEVEQLRGLLDDIAKEKSERAKSIRVSLEQRVRTIAGRLGLNPDRAVAAVLGG